MSEHYQTYSAIFPIILRENNGETEVLLHQRKNTGYMDSMWDFAGSGHVDENETASDAVVRECHEELGIYLSKENVHFVHLTHRLGMHGSRTYYDMYFVVSHFQGTPIIAEPHKCSSLAWFSTNHLPDDMVPPCRKAFQCYIDGIPYSEYSTDKKSL